MNDYPKDGGARGPVDVSAEISAGPPLQHASMVEIVLEMANRVAAMRPEPPAAPEHKWWWPDLADRIRDADVILEYVRTKTCDRMRAFPPFNSVHEGFGVAVEEAVEIVREVWANDRRALKKECIDLAVVLVRMAAELKV